MSAKKPLKSGQPHVGIVLLWYPLFTQPFIFREVESLAQIMPLEVYTLYGRNLRHCSTEMKNASFRGKTYGIAKLLPICWEMAKYGVCHPRKFWQLFKRSLWHHWPNWETFGENLWAFAVGFSLGKQFREDGLDFIYAPWPRGTATAAWVGATLANLPFGMAARGDNLCPADPDLAQKMEAAFLVRANNYADQQRIEEIVHGKTELIYNSLTLPQTLARPVERFQQGKPVRLIALGRFDVTKGFDILLEACAILKKHNFPFTLTLAGGGGKIMGLGDLSHKLITMRQELGLQNEVKMPGLISHDQLPEILEQHDIFVAPCIIHSSGKRDGIPNTVIEAMAFAMPVVATNVNALPEIVRDNETGLTVHPGDPKALANAIMALAADPKKAQKLGENGSKLAKELFDPQTNAQRLATMFAKASKTAAQAGNEF